MTESIAEHLVVYHTLLIFSICQTLHLFFIGFCVVSIVFVIMARFTPYEWDNPYPEVEEPEELENQFSVPNAFWCSIGALMQQGSDVAPLSLSNRYHS